MASSASRRAINATTSEDPRGHSTGLAPSAPCSSCADLHDERTRQRSWPMATLQSAASRIAGGGLLGIIAGGASHAAIAEWTPLGTDAFGAIDPFLNIFDLTIGGICGSMLGVIWALNAALLGSGVIRKTVCDAIGSMVEAEEDKAAGERALSSIRTGLQTLAARNDYLLRTAFFLSGFSEEPAVVRLVDEAQAEQKGSGLAMSDIIAITFETTLEARLGDTRVLIVALAVLLGQCGVGRVASRGDAGHRVFAFHVGFALPACLGPSSYRPRPDLVNTFT